MQTDQLQYALECVLEAPLELEVTGTEDELGIVPDRDLPDPLIGFWLEQRRLGQPIPWTISHRLPARTRGPPSRRGNHALHPITAPGTSLLRNVTALHSFDFSTD
eukprot:1649200-Rhodomonas_salina.1